MDLVMKSKPIPYKHENLVDVDLLVLYDQSDVRNALHWLLSPPIGRPDSLGSRANVRSPLHF